MESKEDIQLEENQSEVFEGREEEILQTPFHGFPQF
jgi:hypothetical protein